MKNHPYKVYSKHIPGCCGEHKTMAGAEKRVGRLVAMSNGKKTREDFEIKYEPAN